jgi:membrane-bound lytic murein transglycosylase D
MKTMLTSQVPIFLCSLTLLIAQPAAAGPGQPSSDAAKTAQTTAAAKANFHLSSTSDVSFALPGRQVRKFVDSYIKSNDDCLSIIRLRSKRPFTIIDSILEHYGMPAELRYLAVIESELKSTAVSRVGARGPWQLMAETARDLGLKVNSRRDERTNYYKSTRAAALYLRDLHNEFKDWLLVLAAYNAGPAPVYRAMHRSHSRNFWALERYLPAESRQHVKRFIATAWYFDQPVPNVVEPMPNAVGPMPNGITPMANAVDLAGDGMGDRVMANIREFGILGGHENYQYDDERPGDTAGAFWSGHSIPAIKEIEQCLAWNEPGAH